MLNGDGLVQDLCFQELEIHDGFSGESENSNSFYSNDGRGVDGVLP